MSSLTYKFYSDAALTQAVTSVTAEQHQDGSSDPVVREVWLGDPEADFLIQDSTNPGVDDIEVSITDTTPGSGHEATEVKLATSEAGLLTAVAGDPLVIGTSQNSGTAGAVHIWIQIDDATGTEGSATELGLACSEVNVTAV